MNEDQEAQVLDLISQVFAAVPFEQVNLADLANASGLSISAFRALYPTVRDAAVAVLRAEGESMRSVQSAVTQLCGSPLQNLEHTFRLTGRNMAHSYVVRAGMRLAAESRHYFPERKINPYRTWGVFLNDLLLQAQNAGEIRLDIDLEQTAWLFVATAIGAKELVAFQDNWAQAEMRFAEAARMLIACIR